MAALALFLACRTQWRILPGFNRNVYLGLDYAGVKAVMELHRQTGRALFLTIQAMEQAALEIFNEEN